MSCVTPPSACPITPCEMPADAASAEMLWTKALKSPPQRAAWAEVAATRAQRTRATRSIGEFPSQEGVELFRRIPRQRAGGAQFHVEVDRIDVESIGPGRRAHLDEGAGKIFRGLQGLDH